MKAILAITLALSAVSCAPITNDPPYPRVKVEVVFTDNTRDTLTVSREHYIYHDGTLQEIRSQYSGSYTVATGVKYIKLVEQ